MNVFDAFEIRARLAPTLIVFSPWVLVLVTYVQSISPSLLTTSAATVIFLALFYALSFAIRYFGLQIEDALWASWGGPPSVILMRETDDTFSQGTKSEMRVYLANVLSIENVAQSDWAEDVDRVQNAFRLVRQHIRQHNPDGLWTKHNTEYGFLRNLLGSWRLWFLNSALVATVCGLLWYVSSGKMLAVLSVLSIVSGLIAIIFRICILPRATRTAAYSYAESAWTSFLTIAKTQKVGT